MKVLFIYFLIFCYLPFRAQNLVPNGSFETYSSCPTGNQFYKVVPWCGLAGGEDSFDTCANSLGIGSNGVPYQPNQGFQYARTGAGIGSVLCYVPLPGNPDRREYLHVPLVKTLQNKKYCGTMYVNLVNAQQDATDRIGMYFSSNAYQCNQAFPMPQVISPILVTPQVENPSGNFISDTLNWIEVSGVFTATGNEMYLTIGNFHDDANTGLLKVYPTAFRTTVYLLIDDVSLEEVHDAQCIQDTNLCASDSIMLGNNVSEAAEYSWSPSAGLSCTNCPNPKAFVSQTTTYTLTKKQCKAVTTASVTITIKNDCGLVNIPNVFTPNEDGHNDTFNITLPLGYSLNEAVIYNRWGNIIYDPEIRNKSVFAWDGHTTSGEKCSEGMYFYVITYLDAKGELQKKNGCVSLFR